MPRSLWTPADPPRAHQIALFVLASEPLKSLPSALGWLSPPTQITGLYQVFRKYGHPCGLCGSLCTLHLYRSAFASFTTATLGMNGWLGLVQQRLSPCKKRQASLGAPTVCGTSGVDWQELIEIMARFLVKRAYSSGRIAPSGAPKKMAGHHFLRENAMLAGMDSIREFPNSSERLLCVA